MLQERLERERIEKEKKAEKEMKLREEMERLKVMVRKENMQIVNALDGTGANIFSPLVCNCFIVSQNCLPFQNYI